jgi:hypothetical protein
MCGWTRQGRRLSGAKPAPFHQRSWRRAATVSTRSQGADMDVSRANERAARRASAARGRARLERPTGCSRQCSAAKPTAASAGARHVAHACEDAYTAPLLPTPYCALHLPKPSLPRPTRYGRERTPRRIRVRLRGHGVAAGCHGGIDDVPIWHVSASSERHQPTRKLSSTVLALTRRLRLLSPARRQGLPALIL